MYLVCKSKQTVLLDPSALWNVYLLSFTTYLPIKSCMIFTTLLISIRKKQDFFGKLSSERNKFGLYVDESGHAHAE